GNGLTDMHRVHTLDIWHAFEIENVSDDFVRVFHFVDAAFTDLVVQPVVAPVLAHFGMDKVLVDGSEIRRQHLVEDVDHTFFCFHAASFLTRRMRVFTLNYPSPHGEGQLLT